jgi:16S rRNA processing protein RimM
MQLVIGKIVRTHGLRGEVVVEITTDEPAARFGVGSVLVTDSALVRPAAVDDPANRIPVPAGVRFRAPDTLTIEAARPHQGRLIIAFAGILDRDTADALRGVRLCVDSEVVVPSDDPDEFHDFELIGLAVVDSAGTRLGEVVRVDHGPAADLLVVRLSDGRDALVPFVRAIVPTVNVSAGELVLTPPDGLFDL